MSTTDSGRLAEVKTMARLVELGWYPFTDVSGKCPVDLLAWNNGEIKSFQVKSCDHSPYEGAFAVQIGSIRPNKTKNVIKNFDNSSVDYLAVYLPALDTVCFIESKLITTKRVVTLREDSGKFLVKNLLTLEVAAQGAKCS